MEGQTKGNTQQNEETATPDARYVLLGPEGGRKNIKTDALVIRETQYDTNKYTGDFSKQGHFIHRPNKKYTNIGSHKHMPKSILN